jgi:thiol:disulfide interchange protein DsbC
MSMKTMLPVYLTGILAATLPAHGDTGRWYTESQRKAGEQLYSANCMTCHKSEGAGTRNWKVRDAQGNLPPPPLNGTAHTWHHSPDILVRTILEGGKALGGSMPGFLGKVDEEGADAIVAYITSLWPEEIYQRWEQRYLGDAEAADSAGGTLIPIEPAPDGKDITALLRRRMPQGTEFSEPMTTPVAGITGFRIGKRYLYLDPTGRYAFTGDLVDLESGENLTETQRTRGRLAMLSEFPMDHRIIYPAKGEERAYLDIFTDTTCPYCRKLHREVPELQNAGVTVRYLPFPRGGLKGAGYDEMRMVWCAEEQLTAMDLAKSEKPLQDSETGCTEADAVDAGYRLGIDVGVTGTPAIFLPDGRLVPGYRPHKVLLDTLGISGG